MPDPKPGRLAGTRAVPIRCHYCSVGCGIEAHVDGAGRLVYLDGDPAHPVNGGRLCPKGMTSAEVSRAPDRVTAPRYRAPGSAEWRTLTWDEALEKVAARLKAARDASWNEALRRCERVVAFGSATVENEEVYLWVKLLRLWGIHYLQHQASI